MTSAGCYVGFDADNWLDTNILGGFIKLNCARHRAVVSNGTSLHAELFHPSHHVRNLGQPVKERVVSVIV